MKKKKSSKKSKRGGSPVESTTSVDTDAIRPDPRWAKELTEIRQRLTATAP